jgi:hypothetical protein
MFSLLVLFALASFVTASDHDCKGDIVNTWCRRVDSGKDIINVTAVLNRVSDPNGTRTKVFLNYSDADIVAQKQKANARFIEFFGLNVLAGNHIASSDTYILNGIGQSLTYANGDNYYYRVTDDSSNKDAAKDNTHIMYIWGLLFQFTTNGTFPGGKLAGKPYGTANIIGATVIEWLDVRKKDQWNNPEECDWKCRDINDGGSERPAYRVLTIEGFTDTYDTSIIVNRRTGDKGYLSSHVTTRYMDDKVSTLQSTRHRVTFNKPMVVKTPF